MKKHLYLILLTGTIFSQSSVINKSPEIIMSPYNNISGHENTRWDLSPDFGASSSITFNISRFIGLKLDATTNFKLDVFTWIPKNSVYAGIVMRIKFKTVELPK